MTVASADEVTGVWSVNHILKLSSQQVAGTDLYGEGLGQLDASNIFMQMSVILVRLNVWSGRSMMPWRLLLPGNVVASQYGVCMAFYSTIPMATSLGM